MYGQISNLSPEFGAMFIPQLVKNKCFDEASEESEELQKFVQRWEKRVGFLDESSWPVSDAFESVELKKST